jgi:L-ascorbate metabolism protein UlaG (beta-lactamase superfamily)
MDDERMLLRALTGLLLALPLSAQAGLPDEGTRPAPKVLGVDVTYLANEGFFLESGRYSVLIDAFVREPVGVFAALPTELHRDMANAKPPFDELTLVLVSHDHPDHVQWRGIEKFLSKNEQAQLITAAPIVMGFEAGAQDYAAIEKRVTTVPVKRGSIKRLLQEEMSIDFFTLEHHGKGDRVFNVAHLIEMGGMRILHVGDADPSPGNFAAHGLAAKDIDIVFVPYWFFGSPAGVKVLFEDIGARIVVACHVPPQELETFGAALKEKFPEVVLFTEPLEKRSFQPAGAPPPPGPTGPAADDDAGG